jgi:hypothetical protein
MYVHLLKYNFINVHYNNTGFNHVTVHKEFVKCDEGFEANSAHKISVEIFYYIFFILAMLYIVFMS